MLISFRSGGLICPEITALFFFTFVTGCAFLTYYSRDSAISAQNALHEKRTLPGVSVYCSSLPTFQPIMLLVMPSHFVSCPLHRAEILSQSHLIRVLSLVAVLRTCARQLVHNTEETIYRSRYRGVLSRYSVCVTFRIRVS